MNRDNAALPAQASALDVRPSRAAVLAVALTNSERFRRFMAEGRSSHMLRDEQDLLWLLSRELERGPAVRRSMVKRLHAAAAAVRQKREWAELQATVARMRKRAAK